jgi:hypothetical protein
MKNVIITFNQLNNIKTLLPLKLGNKILRLTIKYNKAAKVQKKLNRKIIIPVIESVIFCGVQEIALRRHCDFGTLTTENLVENDGNFRALMRFHLNATKLSGDESYQL